MMAELFAQDWARAFGWTLLHSLWQSFVILLFLSITLRCIPLTLSRLRYGLSVSALALFTLVSGYTFFYLLNGAPAPVVESILVNVSVETERSLQNGSSPFRNVILQLASSIESGIPVVNTAWIIGFLIFTIRLVRGVSYTRQLISASSPVNNEWSEYASTMSRRLGIRRLVALAESESIVTPMVIGYFKPVILIPIGMLTGLNTEQLETVFLHELAHIRRRDYLVNLIQSGIETVFFFNPFTWGLSNLIRREREFCCDDLVLQQHKSAGAYANALLHLAEVRLSKENFAMTLAANKNQLLNRIRRIMEKSVESRSEKGRLIIPALLVAVGLLSVSWLSVEEEKNYQKNIVFKQDTLIKKKEKDEERTRYSRKRVIGKDKNGQLHEEVTEEFEGDERLWPLVELDIPLVLPEVPEVELPRPLPPRHPEGSELILPPVPDSIPGLGFYFGDQDEWEAFSKNFEENFRKKFEHLYSEEEIDAAGFLKEFEEEFESQNWPAPWQNFSLNFNFEEEVFEDLRNQLEHLKQLEIFAHPFLSEEFSRYDRILQDELIKDGYLSRGEPIQSIEWSDEIFKVNGRTIKEEDRKKYQQLRSSFSAKSPLGGKLE